MSLKTQKFKGKIYEHLSLQRQVISFTKNNSNNEVSEYKAMLPSNTSQVKLVLPINHNVRSNKGKCSYFIIWIRNYKFLESKVTKLKTMIELFYTLRTKNRQAILKRQQA